MKYRKYEIKPGANLRYANLRYANLKGANLSKANLKGANLTEADLKGANLEDILYSKETQYSKGSILDNYIKKKRVSKFKEKKH